MGGGGGGPIHNSLFQGATPKRALHRPLARGVGGSAPQKEKLVGAVLDQQMETSSSTY